ncbi:hypothetical protein PAMP_011017 [Pampus punctatissimus]
MLNGSLAAPFSPTRANCTNASFKDLQKELDKGIKYSCKDVPILSAADGTSRRILSITVRQPLLKSQLLWDQHMLKSTEIIIMSLHENRLPMKRSEARQAAPTVGTQNDQKHIQRLYPSLPNVDTYDVCALQCSSSEKLRGDTQSEVSVTNSDANMKVQIRIMEKQRQELLSINEKWAKEYRTMVQYYKQKVQDLKALLHRDNFQKGEKHNTLYEKLKIITVKDEESSQAGNSDVNSEVLKAQTEAKELRAQNSALTQRGQHQHEEIRRLNKVTKETKTHRAPRIVRYIKALEETLHITQPLDVSSETLQDVWKHQAEIYKEDFLKERKDREKLKGKYLELEKRLRKAHTELQALKSQATWTQPQPQPVLECTCKCPNGQNRIRFQR